MHLVGFLANFAVHMYMYFACFCEFQGILQIYLKFMAPQTWEMSEALGNAYQDLHYSEHY